MSYSFGITATSKSEAKLRVRQELAKAMVNQPPHCHELPAAMAMADAFIDAQVDGTSYSVSCYGSVSCSDWTNPGTPLVAASINFSVQVS